MQFLDKVTITVVSGKGGDGCVSGRREAGVPYGGPSGGNGGRGGAVILEASKDINTLLSFKYKKKFKAENGEPGRSKEQYGANAENLILKVPIGTLITDISTGQLLYYFSKDKERFAVVHGGLGGLGNMEFKSSTLQYPTFAILGEPGSSKEINLELQLMGDVALIGSPSVGKSTIINALANTKAKVADYHFTTLIPHLGSVKVGDFTFNLVDIPGLIKGASQGKGLGNEFLRHILKAKIFCIVMDLYNFDKGIQEGIDLLGELFIFITQKLYTHQNVDLRMELLNNYIVLSIYEDGEILLQKQINFVFNKFDLIQDTELIQEYITSFLTQLNKLVFKDKKVFVGLDPKYIQKNIFIISAASHYNLEQLTKYRADHLENWTLYNTSPTIEQEQPRSFQDNKNQQNRPIIKDISGQEREKLLEDGYVEEEELEYSKIWYWDNPTVSRLVFTLPRGNDEAEMWFWSMIDKEGYLDLIQKAGARKGDIFKVKSYYADYDDRYIQW